MRPHCCVRAMRAVPPTGEITVKLCSGCGTKLPDTHRGRCAACKSNSGAQNPDLDLVGIKSHTPPGAGASRDELAHLYRDPRWTAVSKLQRARFPLCEEKCGRLAEIADHHIPANVYIALCREKRKFLIPDGAFFDMSNLRSLCRICHDKKSRDDEFKKAHGGPWPELGRPPKKWSF